jgi:cysteinyl-tRNA synthetase
MSQEIETESATTNLAELKKLFGAPPVLASESTDAYYAIMDAFAKCFKPEDFMTQMFMKDLTDSTWDAMRYTRHKTLTMERKYRQRLEHQVERFKQEAQRKEQVARTKKPAAQEREEEAPDPVLDRSFELLGVCQGTSDEVDKILSKTPTEIDHAQALEAVIEYHERLDELQGKAITRRNDVLEQIALYRESLGHHLRRVSDAIIDAEFTETKPAEVPLVPTSG